jgi:hypothetical protein
MRKRYNFWRFHFRFHPYRFRRFRFQQKVGALPEALPLPDLLPILLFLLKSDYVIHDMIFIIII